MIKKVVIPAAGLGTRLLPITKALPKEMLPIVDRPAIQYIISEAVSSGIEEVLIITGRHQKIYEDYFSESVELEAKLIEKGSLDLVEKLNSIKSNLKISYINQENPKGLGHAISIAKEFVGNEPFAVMLPDDIIDSDTPCLQQLIAKHNEYNCSVIGVQKVLEENVNKYGIIDGQEIAPNTYEIKSLVEKPAVEDAPSNIAVVGRYILSSKIFNILENLTPGVGGEIQLTDGILKMLEYEKAVSYVYEGKRFDVGNSAGLLAANVYFANKA